MKPSLSQQRLKILLNADQLILCISQILILCILILCSYYRTNPPGQPCVTRPTLPRYSSQEVSGLLPKAARLKCSTQPMKEFHTQNSITAAPECMWMPNGVQKATHDTPHHNPLCPMQNSWFPFLSCTI